MPQNVFDQSGRFFIKLDPLGVLLWLMRLKRDAVVFRRWLDTRRLPFPGEPDRICDTVAFIEAALQGHIPWAVVVEFQLEPDALMFGRLLIYLGQVWLELKPSEERGDRFWLGAIVVNLTGRGNGSRTMAWDEAGMRTELTIREVNCCDLDAHATLDEIKANETTPAVLAVIPLLHGGGDSGIIQQWMALASAEPDARRRGEYGALALIFAEAAGNRPAWKQALAGWNMIQSQQVLEWKAEAKVEILLRVLRGRFGTLPPDVEISIHGTIDSTLLDQWAEAAGKSATLDDFRQTTRL